jgi:RHS repeat-associated protein
MPAVTLRRYSARYLNGYAQAPGPVSTESSPEHLQPRPRAHSTPYAYDTAGQRTSRTDGQGNTLPDSTFVASYDEANRLNTIVLNGETFTLAYDDNGNLSTKTGPTSGTTIYTWSAKNQLVALSGPSGVASFKYDAMGRRTEKTVNGQTTGFLYDGVQAIAELRNGSVDTAYHTGLAIDEVLARYGTSGDKTLLQDALMSVVVQTNDAGSAETFRAYSAYGEAVTLGVDNGDSLQYTGRENDGIGTYFYRARYYDPIAKQFISEDPIGILSGLNSRSYVGGNPVTFTDPTGEIAWVVAGAVIGAGVNVAATLIATGGNASQEQLIAAAVSGGISGAFGALAGPLGGSVARALGQTATGVLAKAVNVAFSAAGGFVGQTAANCIDPSHATDPLASAAFGGLGGVGSSFFRTPGLYTIKQAQYFAPTTLRGINGSYLSAPFAVSATIGAGSNFYPY